MATANRPERFDLFTLPENTPKLTYHKDEQVPDAGTFRILKEDHTLGNILRMQLLRDPNVIFAGYKVPHPLETEIQLKVRTKALFHPIDQVHGAIQHLQQEISDIRSQFVSQIQRRKHGMEM